MDTFGELEAKYARAPVRLVGNNDAAGVLRLRGRRTRLSVTAPTELTFPTDEDGWSDLLIQTREGREMLLHHAFAFREATHHWTEQEAFSADVYPNVVVEDTRGLTAGRQVQRIQFRLRGMHQFFHYRHTESLRVYETSEENVATLRSMRYRQDEIDLFDPMKLFVVHSFPEFFTFRVADREYTVWAGGRFGGLGWDRLTAKVYPVALINFDEPVDIDTALDRVWEWRRFFSQVAMQPIPLTGISVCGTLEPRAVWTNVYLPNLKRRTRKVKGRYELRARHIPLNDWGSRSALAAAMQAWLTIADDRRAFRSALDRVIGRMSRRIDPGDLIDLAAAVESLAELTERTPFPDGALDTMSAAAHAAAVDAGLSIEEVRFRGLLGALQRASLSEKMRLLGQRTAPAVEDADVQLVVRSATRIRNARAHGDAIDAQLQPRVAPTVQALAAMCARFDLETSGLPDRSPWDAKTLPRMMMDEGVEKLRSLEPPSELNGRLEADPNA